MQLAALHQIIDALPAAAQQPAGFGGVHNPMLHKAQEILQRKRYAYAVFMQRRSGMTAMWFMLLDKCQVI